MNKVEAWFRIIRPPIVFISFFGASVGALNVTIGQGLTIEPFAFILSMTYHTPILNFNIYLLHLRKLAILSQILIPKKIIAKTHPPICHIREASGTVEATALEKCNKNPWFSMVESLIIITASPHRTAL